MLKVTIIYYFNCGYTFIISGLFIDIIRIKNGIVIYNLLNENIVKLTPYTPEI